MRRLTFVVFSTVLVLGSSLYAWAAFYSGVSFDHIWPKRVGNTASVTITIDGDGLDQITAVNLSGAQLATPIVGQIAAVLDDGQRMLATFDLTGVQPGSYEVHGSYVDSYSGQSSTSAWDMLNVEEGGTSALWSSISGRSLVRIGALEDYTVYYGNSGNVTIDRAILTLAIPHDAQYELLFDPTPFQTFWSPALVQRTGDLEAKGLVTIDGTEYDLLPLVVRNIAPQTVKALSLRIVWPNTEMSRHLRAYWTSAAEAAPWMPAGSTPPSAG